MTIRGVFFAFVLLLLGTGGAFADKPLCRDIYGGGLEEWSNCTVQIGGLAISSTFMTKMLPTFQTYLTDMFEDSHGLDFELLPLNFNENFEFVGANALDFIYSNPGAYTCMMVEFNIVTVASLLNFRKGNALEKFAGVIFSRADSNFSTIESLRHARVEAVSISGLGAMQMQQATLLRKGLNVMSDVPRLTFAYGQGKIVKDVENGYADVGFVRTDMIDRQVAANVTKWEYFQVINEINDTEFPFARSTDFTPEWPIGALPHVPFQVMELVGEALMALDVDSPDPLYSGPASAGSFSTWIPPMNYFGLLSMLEEIGYYDASSRKCLRSADVHAAINCPAGYILKAPELAFCGDDSGQECKDGYDCICDPCAKLEDPEFVLSTELVSTSWLGSIDVPSLTAMTSTVSQCERMGECAEVADGQLVKWTLLDQIGRDSRLQISAPLVNSVEMQWRVDGNWVQMVAENVSLSGGITTQRYTFTGEASQIGTHIVQVRINGEQAPMSPIVSVHFEPPQRLITCGGGEFADQDGMCLPCPAGTHGALEGNPPRPVCRPCGLGTFNNFTNRSACELCPMGYKADAEGSLECTACLAGSSTLGKEGKAVCDLCQPGQEAPLNGSARCTPCDYGFFSSEEGAIACTSCEVAASKGMTTPNIAADDVSLCGCPQGSYLADKTSTVKECRTCLDPGTTCRGFGKEPLVQTGFYMAPDASRSAWELDVFMCIETGACPGQKQDGDPICADRLEGRNCALCPEFYSKGNSPSCRPCAGEASSALDIFLLLFFAFVIFLIAGIVNWKISTTQLVRSKIVFSVAAGLFLSMLQIVSLFSLLTFEWPDSVRSMMTASRTVLFNFKSLPFSCIFPESAESAYLMPLTLPLIAGLYLAAWSPLSKVLSRFAPDQLEGGFNKEGLLNTYGTALQALFISLVSITVSILDCYESPNTKQTVRSLPYVVCWEGRHLALMPATVLAVLVYVVGILAGFSYLCWKAPALSVNAGFAQSTRFLFQKFTARTWWFGIVLLVRSACLALVTVVVPNTPHAQYYLAVVILGAGLCLHLVFQPYIDRTSNLLESIQLTTLVLVICIATWFIEDPGKEERLADKTMSGALAGIIMFCLIANLISLAVGCAWNLLVFKFGFQNAKLEAFRIQAKEAWIQSSKVIAQLTSDELDELLLTASYQDIMLIIEISTFVATECPQYAGKTMSLKRVASNRSSVSGTQRPSQLGLEEIRAESAVEDAKNKSEGEEKDSNGNNNEAEQLFTNERLSAVV